MNRFNLLLKPGSTTLSATLALLLLSPATKAGNALVPDGLYQLHDGPGFAYGMIFAGLFNEGKFTSKFSFDATAQGADMKMLVAGSQIHIYGTAWEYNQTGSEALWEIDMLYTDSYDADDPVDDDLWANSIQPGAYLRRVDNPAESYWIDAYPGSNPFALSLGDGENDQGISNLGGPGEISGFGWMNHDQTFGQVVDEFGNFSTQAHSGPTDWTFTAEYIPEPSSSLLTGIGGCLLLARRRRPDNRTPGQ